MSFAHHVLPILAEHCVPCHGPDAAAREGGLRLDRPGRTGGGWSSDLGGHAAVVPGDPAASALLERVRAQGRRRMPPPHHSAALDASQISLLERWITDGAPYAEHWAYAPFRDVDVPGLDASAHPIDAFVDARLSEYGLERALPASRRVQLRRVSLDLTGLPPTPEELAAFLDDDEAGSYERAVDRLLGSKAYAEHWTRGWMDLARYADSNGFTIDGERSIWPWRDWVLRSIHEDEPFDRFTLRQIAGDLLPDATNADVIATGFHRNTQVNQEGGAKDEENRINAVHDRVATTGAVWLGTTTECARCHDHKFDPVTTRDYYRLFAFFDSTEDGGVHGEPQSLVARDVTEERRVKAYESDLRASRKALRAAEERAAEGWTTWQPSQTKADNGPELVPQLDGSYRALGQAPVYTVYSLTGAIPSGGVASVRIEALPEVGLPGGGPGRVDDGNFVLTNVRVEWRAPGETGWTQAPAARASADFEQDGRAEGGRHFAAAHVLDEDARTGWAVAPAFGRPHVLHLDLAQPVPAEAGELRLALAQEHGKNATLGRFRVRTRPVPAHTPIVPVAWQEAFRDVQAVRRNRPDLPTSLVLRERSRPRQSHVLLRGNYLDPGEAVEPGFPAALGGPALSRALESARDPSRAARLDRLDLARWLTHPENALAHRVTVNRWWQAFFGAGLVRTENDFGLRGATPSHPELLDWLAQEFVRAGFSRKAVHRRIVTSATYRQQTAPAALVSPHDPTGGLLSRQRRLRLPAESIRDAALLASGLLAPRFGGPPVQPPQPEGVFAFTQATKSWVPSEGPDRYRRTLYTRIWRSSVHPFLSTFDAPPPTVSCTRRERSTSALQALTLANDPMIQELAAALGARARRASAAAAGTLEEPSSQRRAAVRHGFLLALGRAPSSREESLLLRHVEREEARLLELGNERALASERAWTAVGRILINLDEFVTRP